MNGFWEHKFEELANFNAEKDKTKYNDKYLDKMKSMQKEYDDKLKDYCNNNGHIFYECY